jgi:signal transduction histidine kinase
MDEDVAIFPIKDIFNELSHLHGYQARKKRQNLVVHCPNEPELTLNSRRKPIFHILSNFLGNAVKFTPEEGVITINAELIADGRLRLSVQDTGIGIKTEDINRIFDRFVQADEVLTKSYGGTGLGLAIAKEMAETLGAELDVSSVPGQGSCFALIMPSSTLIS